MKSTANNPHFASLLSGEPKVLSAWVENWNTRHLILNLAVIVAGTSAYGASVGIWRDETQALYTAIKLPLLILLTSFGNAFLNGMLAPLLGAKLRFRQSLLAVLMSFATASAILGGFSPIVFFLIWNVPPIGATGQAGMVHDLILFIHVLAIGFAGTVGNLKLFRYLSLSLGDRSAAMKILFSWLVANLFFGAQLSWILRPFIGTPGLPVQFVRSDALEGNFYESVLYIIRRLFF